MKGRLPNFLIVGAAKCGTSSLHQYLNQHPDIFMPTYTDEGLKVKEPRFLIKEKVQKRLPKGVWDLKTYKSLFEKALHHEAIGESTVLYLFFYQTAIKNIKYYLGNDVKIIIMLRNPIERAYSAYLFASRTTQENLPFEEALKYNKTRYDKNPNLSPMILYKELGLYYKMVRAYIENFKNVHCIIYDDFVADTNLEITKVLNFLDLDDKYKIDSTKIINMGGMSWNSAIAKEFLMGNGTLKKIIKTFISKKTRVKAKQKLVKQFTVRAADMDEDLRKKLFLFYKSDIKKLEKLIKRDLSLWRQN